MGRGIRLRAYLMGTGRFQRASEAVKLVESGKVLVNGEVITNPEFHVSKKDSVQVKGTEFQTFERKQDVYIVFNKPRGFVCQKTKEEQSIYDLIDKIPEFDNEVKKTLFCVGRLDRDTEGLLIVTNDGNLANKLLRPEKHIPKTYLVGTEKQLAENNLKKLESGVKIRYFDTKETFDVKALHTKLISPTEAEVTIDEGKKRQVKLMFEAIGNKVVSLKRISIGHLKLESLEFKGRNYIILEGKNLENIIFK